MICNAEDVRNLSRAGACNYRQRGNAGFRSERNPRQQARCFSSPCVLWRGRKDCLMDEAGVPPPPCPCQPVPYAHTESFSLLPMLRDLLNKVVSSVRGGERQESDSPDQVRAAIRLLETQVKSATPQQRAQLYNRLGDLYAKGEDRSGALKAYGRGIDSYLENGYYDAAAALCRKVIEIKPDVIRARCTLAFLSLGKEMLADAQREISYYVDVSRRAGMEDLAIKRLHLMAEATDSHETRTMLGELLLELGDAEGADDVLGAVNAERNALSGPPQEEQRDRWARLLRVAITDTEPPPQETKRR